MYLKEMESLVSHFHVTEKLLINDEIKYPNSHQKVAQHLASQSEGAVLTAGDVLKVPSYFGSGTNTYTETIHTSVWDNWFYMFCLFLLLGSEWIMRKRKGLS